MSGVKAAEFVRSAPDRYVGTIGEDPLWIDVFDPPVMEIRAFARCHDHALPEEDRNFIIEIGLRVKKSDIAKAHCLAAVRNAMMHISRLVEDERAKHSIPADLIIECFNAKAAKKPVPRLIKQGDSWHAIYPDNMVLTTRNTVS